MNKLVPIFLMLMVATTYAISWNQTTTDWNEQEINRFENFTIQLNASGGETISYSDNSTLVVTDTTTGISTWKPDDNFVGKFWVTYNASNTTNQITNEVEITVNYVNYYDPPGNISNLGELVVYANEVSNFRFGIGILLALFAIAFITLMMFTGAENAITSASFITIVVATIMGSQGWITQWTLILLIIVLSLGTLALVMLARKA